MSAPYSEAIILIVDDHPIYVDGISYWLQTLFDKVQIIRAHTAAEAIAVAENNIALDWIFLDQQLPDKPGLELLKTFSELMVTAPIIMISASDDVELIANAIELGASGFVCKSGAQSVYQACMTAIEQGDVFVPVEFVNDVAHYRKTVLGAKKQLLQQLSARRMDILVMLAAGYSNAEIAASLAISETTVKTHVSALMSIFEADNRSHCVAEARKWGIIP